jgi:ABC-type lipoprotein release transport system permease subunit
MSAKQTFNRWSFLRAGLRHYWRSHLAVATGTAVAAAVLAGALIVGDSVRASLKAMTLDRLGDVDFAMSGPRFVREMLAQETSNNTGAEQPTMESAPAILLTGAVESNEGDSHRRAADVEVVACDGRLWKFLRHGDLDPPQENTVILSGRTADQLQAEIGDQVSLLVEIPQSIPRDALLGDREQTVAELLLTVSAIADESTGIARFGLNPSQQLPRNASICVTHNSSLASQRPPGLAATRWRSPPG